MHNIHLTGFHGIFVPLLAYQTHTDTNDLFCVHVYACQTDKKVENSLLQTCSSSVSDVTNKINRTRWIKHCYLFFHPLFMRNIIIICQIIENWHESPFPSGHRRISHQDSGRWGFMAAPDGTPYFAGVKAELRDTRYWIQPN